MRKPFELKVDGVEPVPTFKSRVTGSRQLLADLHTGHELGDQA